MAANHSASSAIHDSQPAGDVEQTLETILSSIRDAETEEIRLDIIAKFKEVANFIDEIQREPRPRPDNRPTSAHQRNAQIDTNVARKRGVHEIDDDGSSTIDDASTRGDQTVENEQIQPASKRPKRRPKSKRPSSAEEFEEVTLDISREFRASDLQRSRDSYYEDLLKLQTVPTKVGQEPQPMFNEVQAAELASFFFVETMGPACLERLVGFVRAYSQRVRGEPDVGAAARMDNIVRDRNVPIKIRHFYNAFSLQQSHKLSTDAQMMYVQQVNRAIKLLRSYYQVCDDIEKKDPDMMTFLGNHGLSKTGGHGWSSVARDFLAKIIGIDREIMSRACERARGINKATEKLGDAFILLTPPGSMSRLHKVGTHRLGPACDLLIQHCPIYAQVCSLVNEHIYQPYLDGVPSLPILADKLSKEKIGYTFMDRINKAVDTDSVEDEEDSDDE